MKLGKSVLLEIVAIVQNGLLKKQDISQKLREIDVDVKTDTDDFSESVELSRKYIEEHPDR